MKIKSETPVDFSDARGRNELVYQLVGAGSTCWDDLEKAGVFREDHARRVAEAGLKRLAELDRPLLGLATTEQLLAEIKARLEREAFVRRDDMDIHAVAGKIQIDMLLATLSPETLKYRTVDS